MNLLWQLLPFTLLAASAITVLAWYVARASKHRRSQRVPSSYQAQPDPPPIPWRTAVSTNPRAQILRLHEFGITTPQIASVLALPQEEVELVIQLARFALKHPSHRPGVSKSAGVQVS